MTAEAITRAEATLIDGKTAHVRVLLATHNGVAWLEEQLQSIIDQQGVRVSVIASDDR